MLAVLLSELAGETEGEGYIVGSRLRKESMSAVTSYDCGWLVRGERVGSISPIAAMMKVSAVNCAVSVSVL